MSENTESKPFNLGTVLEDAKRVITDPVGFYRDMPKSGGFADPMIFVAAIAVLIGVAAAIFSVIGLGKASMAFAGVAGFSAVIIIPIFAVIGSFIGGAILFVIWKLMGSEHNYETAYRCVAYAYAIAPIALVLSIIPYLGTIIKGLWGTFLMYTASVEVHSLKAQTAKIVFGVLAAIGIFSGLSSERAMRTLEHRFERVMESTGSGDFYKKLENGEEITAEEAGKQVGEFLKGLEKFSKGLEEAAKEEETTSQD